MTKLSDDLKRMLTSLAYQDAGEFLSTRDKMKVLGITAKPNDASPSPALKMVSKPASDRIAFISDGRGRGAPLDYAIDTCLRLGAKIDLLIHSAVDKAEITALEDRIRSTGLYCQTIQLSEKPVNDILNYIHNQPSIASIVAMPDDEAAKQIVEEMIPGHSGRIDVPLVLIGDRSSPHPSKQSAA